MRKIAMIAVGLVALTVIGGFMSARESAAYACRQEVRSAHLYLTPAAASELAEQHCR